MNKPRKETIRLFFAQVKKYKWAVIILIIATAAHVFAQIYAHVVFRDFLDVIISASDASDAVYASALSLLLVYALVIFVEIAGDKVVHVMNIYFQVRAMGNLATDAFHYIHKHSYEFFNNTFIGSLVKKVNRYVRAFERVADIFTWNFFRLVLTILFVLIWLFLIEPVLGWVVVIWVVVFLSVNYLFALKKVKYDLAKAAADSVVSGVLADTFTNNANVKLFAGLRYEFNQFVSTVDDWIKKTRKA
jgi:ATP-binding cassette subfamily B protein